MTTSVKFEILVNLANFTDKVKLFKNTVSWFLEANDRMHWSKADLCMNHPQVQKPTTKFLKCKPESLNRLN